MPLFSSSITCSVSFNPASLISFSNFSNSFEYAINDILMMNYRIFIINLIKIIYFNLTYNVSFIFLYIIRFRYNWVNILALIHVETITLIIKYI